MRRVHVGLQLCLVVVAALAFGTFVRINAVVRPDVTCEVVFQGERLATHFAREVFPYVAELGSTGGILQQKMFDVKTTVSYLS